MTRAAARERRRLERLRTAFPVRAGTVLAREGRPCVEFGVVVEGTALVTRDGRFVALLEPGQSFGELGLVRALPNPVTITAGTEVTLAVMNVREFHSAYTTMPAFRAHVDHEIDRRLATWLGPRTSAPVEEADYTLAS